MEQIGEVSVHRAARAVAVSALVPRTDGCYHAVEAFAGEWTSSAVHLRGGRAQNARGMFGCGRRVCDAESLTAPSVSEQAQVVHVYRFLPT